ncbi:nuclear body protein SP140-like isoform X2 [Parambassis ranga]|nr:nuclear body protein SP140-like isoform X2 [Parambassis ranga]
MKSRERIKSGVYELLDWLERKRKQHIRLFWSCIFKETILNQYPQLKLLRNSLMDGSFQFDTQLPEKVEKDDGDNGKDSGDDGRQCSEDKEKKTTPGKKRGRRRRSSCDVEHEEQPGCSSTESPAKRMKSKKISYCSPLKRGEKSDIWTWPIYKTQLPVSCGHVTAMLLRDRLAKGEKCIVVDKQWFTPTAFEKFAGKQSSKNWKLSIRCRGTPLGKLIEEGHLEAARFKRKGRKRVQKSLFLSEESNSGSDGTEEEEEERQHSSSDRESSSDDTDEEAEMEEEAELPSDVKNRTVFKVTCGTAEATLHKKRFASGTCGKSIRTETSWMSPVEFTRDSCQTDDWRKDIMWEGRPLGVLIQSKVLKIHCLLCKCMLCRPEPEDLEHQKNDDECYVCKRGEEEEEEDEEKEQLVVCDRCPRSFHPKCHLPHIEDAIIGDDRPWFCTFCVFKLNQQCLRSADHEASVMSQQISKHMLQCQYILLCLRSADEEQLFATNPSLCLENVADRLQRTHYQTVGDFVSDVQLIFTNCASSSQDNAETCDQLKKIFEEGLKKVFNIRQRTAD